MTDATSPCPAEVSSGLLSHPAAVLFGLEHQFRVLHAERTAPEAIKVLVKLTAREGPCPGVWGADDSGEGTPSQPAEGPARLGTAGGAVVAQTPVRVPGDTVPAAIVRAVPSGGAAAWPGHRTAA